MIKTPFNLSQVKDSIEKMKEKEVDVTLNLGRNKFVSFVLEQRELTQRFQQGEKISAVAKKMYS